MQVASRDLDALIISDDFRRLVAGPVESPHLRPFIQALIAQCMKQQTNLH